MGLIAYVGLGANLGDRRASLTRAVSHLRGLPTSRVQGVSAMREYAADGGPSQPPYLNAVVALETTLTPRQLLDHFHRLEAAAGRVRPDPVRWGPRPLDLDLLLYGDTMIAEPDLTVPHPRLADRLFVLEPLVELAPNARHPVLHLTVSELLNRCRTRVGSSPGGVR
ncbi:MAG: 2-amino-4-hydroxy-6-hydroxymethyldihydropteridine diphosphokinase [Omnitrophica WOR_2 bacterium RIFCSPHIGHO2_02_FULL_68_15]|nr:MAG: 2-amino-4-hydroxy-6-hydroxymethyldihydropteridine diphosphokinase [Omnitrophica WOR_2 bacterium RIFCSPHIGHO2_02_FULL_68_15]